MPARQLAPLFCFALTTIFTFVQNSQQVAGQEFVIHEFTRQALTDVYFSEGANAGNINGDDHMDVVYGPYWFAGPDFKTKSEIYKPVPQNMEGYADNFFNWVHDFDGDGDGDVFVVGFPGTPAYVYENPGNDGHDEHWKKHQVFDWVSNESPQLTDLVGDERPELICTRDGFFGFVTVNWEEPFSAWEFHPISEKITAGRFGHGLGIGDINGDGKHDIIHSTGWFEQPEGNPGGQRWAPHAAKFSSAYGGAEMYAYDVDGDGDNDVITSEAAHDFGLSWYEQKVDGDERTFERHLIMGAVESENRYGVLFSELHSVALRDMDGDGLKDIITGKTFYSHHQQSPMWDAGAVVYWFKLTRDDEGNVDWIPYQADTEAGIGRQVSVHDLNGDGLLDIIVGGMKGSHVLIHQTKKVSEEAWKEAQPKVFEGGPSVSAKDAELVRGPSSPIDSTTGTVPGAIEGESLKFSVTAGKASAQPMQGFAGDKWSGNSQLWWTGARPGAKLTATLPKMPAKIDFQIALTCAVDYGIVQLAIDDQPLGPPIDCYNDGVITTGVLNFSAIELEGDDHVLTATIVGRNPKAVAGFMVGIDYVRFKSTEESFPEPAGTFKPVSKDGTELNLDFETGTLANWKATGNAFEGQPIQGDTVRARRSDMSSRHQGSYWIGGFEKLQDGATGTLTSEPFVVDHPYASFLASGGKQSGTRVELIRADSGKVVYQVAGNDSENLRMVSVDVRAHVGKELQIRLVDEAKGGWGHLNFDHFRLHDKRPAPATSPIQVLVADEYPHSGLDAEAAANAMTVPDGFTVSVGAAEPEVKQPIAMALDERGRVWIAEAYEYPVRAEGDSGRDRILIFEDTDQDGTLDKRTVFAEGLNLISGLEVGMGGVWVGAAPYLMFIPDRDHDDVPDSEPQILLDGWGYQDTHETLNAFIWGPDGWLYGCHGVFTHSLVGKPGTPEKNRVKINAGIWRYHPVRHEFEVFAHGTSNPWGVDFDDHGQAFATACVIPHLFHIIHNARYQRQAGQHFNPYTYRDIGTVADHLHYLGATPHSGNDKSDEAGGGHAHAGAMIYLGGRWPETFHNQLFMNNIHGQRLNVDVLEQSGSGYVGHHGPDFLLTGDRASQILNLRYGPDGDAWMIDWYDMQACHRREVEVHDRTNGRIYKISYGELAAEDRELVDRVTSKSLYDLSDVELAELTLHHNEWFVRHGRKVLQERSAAGEVDANAVARLKEIATTHPQTSRVLRAMWTLHAIGQTSSDLIASQFGHDDPYVRGWAVQLAMDAAEGNVSSSLIGQLNELATGEASPVVRLFLAGALQQLPLESRWSMLDSICQYSEDATDHNLPLMYWYAAEPLADVDAERALAFAMTAGERIPLLREFMLRRIGSNDTSSSLTTLVTALGKATKPEDQMPFLKAIRAALRGQRQVQPPTQWSDVYARLKNSGSRDVQLEATALGVTFGDPNAMSMMREQLIDTSIAAEERKVALGALLDAKDAELATTLHKLVKDEALRSEAIRGLALYSHPATPEALLSVYDKLNPSDKRSVLATLCARVAYGKQLLTAVDEGKIAGTELTADLVRQMQFLKDDELNGMLNEVWGTTRETAAEKLELINKYKALVQSAGDYPVDASLGRAVFAKTCMRCHVLYGVGTKVGPDLTGSNRADLDYLLSNIVDPSSVMAKEYQPTVVITLDGRVVTGLITEENDNAITLQTTEEPITIPLDEIDERALSEKSMMPDDQLKFFSDHEIRSLIAYLSGKTQVPMNATSDNSSMLFNGKDLTGWNGDDSLWSVEDGEIVGKTATGIKRNEWLVSDLVVGDFRLSVEIKLVDNQGNSGIQFRSEAEEGSVSGYQADVGAGWWGKLYEEHGRALLWDQSGEEHVKKGEWNTYVVEAKGHQIRTYINGELCVDLDDPEGKLSGIIAFQLHSGGPTEVRFRNLELKVLDSATE